VWVGFDDARGLGLSGSRAALPIFAQFMRNAIREDGSRDFPVPNGVEVVEIDQETGLVGGPGCRGEPEVFLRGTAPDESCSPYWNPRSNRPRWSTWERSLVSLYQELERRLERRRN
jgi:membrane carboxypeptidase/penicillin-binding protein